MLAYQIKAYGGPEKSDFAELGKPRPGPGEILIDVRAAGLNPVDWKTREGKMRPVLRFDLPVTMGNELSGVVAANGDGATRFAKGDRVFARVGKEEMGAFADFAVVKEAHCAAIPDNLDFAQAAAVPLAGLTALQAIRDELKVGPGFRLFISAGAGGVGTFAIQIAKALGAHVVTTASERGRDLAAQMGADQIVDYEKYRFEDVIDPVDGAFDLVGGDTLRRTFKVVKKGGRVVSIAGTPEPRTAAKDIDGGAMLKAMFWVASFGLRREANKHGVDYRFLLMHPSGEELAELATMVDEGKVTPIIDTRFDFVDLPDAMAKLERGHAKGKIVVEMD